MKDDRGKPGSESAGGSPSSLSGFPINVRDSLSFIPDEKLDENNEWARDWNLELESRYRADGSSLSTVDLNYRQTRVNLHWVDDIRCILACRARSDGIGRTDLYLAGPRAILAVHRYIGRVKRIGGSGISKNLSVVVGLYCGVGGARSWDTTALMRAAGAFDVNERIAEAGRDRKTLTLREVNIRLIHELIERGADINAEDMIGNTALSHAALSADRDAFEVLTAAGARTDISFEGHTLLHEAASGGNVPIISTLIGKGLNVNAVDWMGFTPICFALTAGHVEATELFLGEGAWWRIEASPTTSLGANRRIELAKLAEATLGNAHRLTKMLRQLEDEASGPERKP